MIKQYTRNVVILVPAYNPDVKLLSLLDDLRRCFSDILVVNDGSTAGLAVFEEIEKRQIKVLKHEVNRGKGAALKTGFKWIYENLPDSQTVVTADADGQHRFDDIVRVAEASLVNPKALTLGVRSFSGSVPLRSRFGNWWTRQIFFLLTHLHIQDTQTGLRGIPVSLLPHFVTLSGERYEFEIQMLADARCRETPPIEVPIETVYIDSNSTSHFNPLRDSMRIYGALIRFCLSSVGCFLLDNTIFTAILCLLMRLTDWKRALCVLYAIMVARVVSATTNYVFNRKLVFRSKASRGVSFLKYWSLVSMVLLIGYSCTAICARIFDAHGFWITFLKIVVETGLFFLSYKVQKKWVFGAQ